MKGQLSAEMLILIVVVLAIVAIAATTLINQGKASAENVEKSTAKITASSTVCDTNSDCETGYTCDKNTHLCTK